MVGVIFGLRVSFFFKSLCPAISNGGQGDKR